MPSVLPKLVDRYRKMRNGRRRYVGQVLMIDGESITVIAEVYGWTLTEMRRRKHAVAKILKSLEKQ